MERSAGPHDQIAVLRDRCDGVWPGKGPDRVRKAIALLLLTKASKEGHQLRLHVLGHMLNVQLGRDWKHKYGVDTPLTQFLQSAPFKVVPTDISNVDAVRLDLQQLLSLQRPHKPAANAHEAGGVSSKVWVVAKPGSATLDGPLDAHAASAATAAVRPVISTTSNSHSSFSPKAAGDKGAAVLAYINSMRWHEQPQINMLRQALASNIVRKATGADGRIAAATESQSYCISAAHAVSVVDRAWHGRFTSAPNPHNKLEGLLAGNTFLHLLPAASPAASSTSASSNTSHSAEARVQLDIQLLLSRMAGKGFLSHGSPAAPQTPTPAGAKLVINTNSTTGLSNPAGEAAAAKLIGLLSGKAGKPAATAVLSRAVGAAVAATANSAAAAVAAETPQACAGDTGIGKDLATVQPDQQQGRQKGLHVHKKHLLNFIQRRQWDRGVDYNLMKRAVATFLVNKAADGAQVCYLEPVSIHVAKAGEVFHLVWTGRHGPATKPYKKVADVLGDDPFMTIIDGPQHARQLVQLDIKAMAAAAGCIAGHQPGEAVQVARLESASCDEASVATPAAGEAVQQTVLQVDAGSNSTAGAAASEATAGSADAVSVEAQAEDGSLLALDLLAYAASVTWHESNPGLALLRQQLAVMMIEAAHPGLAEAVAAGEQIMACGDAALYVMSPYAAGSALMAIWQAKCSDQPRPYSTLPSALEGCKYLVLKLAASGYQAQLDLQRYKQDCRAAMQQMQSAWHDLIESSAAALSARAATVTPKPGAAGSLATAAAVASDSSNSPNLLQRTESNSSQPVGEGADTTQGSPSAPCGSASSSGVGHDSCANAAAGHAAGPSMHDAGMQQLQVPNMQQLLSLLSCAPPGVCQHAGVVWVPEAVQHLMFTEQDSPRTLEDSTHGSQRHAATAWAFDGGYQLYGIQKLQDAAGVNRMLDHLLACPILAVGCCAAPIQAAGAPSGPAGARGIANGAGTATWTAEGATKQQHQLLLHVLAPPVVGRDSGSALDASVYVFEASRQKMSQQQQSSAAGSHDKLQLLVRILLEDACVVKLVDGHHVLQMLQEHYDIKAAGVLGRNMLESLLGAREVLDALTEGSFDVGGLEGYVAAYKISAGQLEGSHNILRSLLQQGCPEGKPISAELITTAASTVRPLMPLALSMLQLLPVALMRRCMMGGVVQP